MLSMNVVFSVVAINVLFVAGYLVYSAERVWKVVFGGGSLVLGVLLASCWFEWTNFAAWADTFPIHACFWGLYFLFSVCAFTLGTCLSMHNHDEFVLKQRKWRKIERDIRHSRRLVDCLNRKYRR